MNASYNLRTHHPDGRAVRTPMAAKQQTTRSPAVAGSTDICPSELFFQTEDGRDVKSGPWARDLVRMGRMFAAADCDSPLTFALSLPVLDFAGPLMAAGFIAERAQRRLDGRAGSAATVSKRAQLFRQLCALPVEMPVLLRLNSGINVHAIFEGVETISDESWAVIRFQKESKGAGRQFINEAKAHRVIFVAGLNAEATEDVIGKATNVRLGLAEGFVADDFALRELILRSAPECALIGVVKTLSGELCDAKLAARKRDGSAALGTLQDIVRAANLMRADECFRTKLFAVKAKATETGQWSPGLAIFCGSSAYLSQAARFPVAHHAVLLSPIERDFDAAVASLNEAFLSKLGEVPDRGWATPEGVLAMGFQRRPATAR